MSTPEKTSWSWPFACVDCHRPFPAEGREYRCPHCGGLYDFLSPIAYSPLETSEDPSSGLARYRNSFPLPPDAPLISLGEGGTPLLEHASETRTIFFKCEHLNPTGSFKDRGSAVLVSALCSAGVREAVEDSSGNAGSSFAAYCARAGVRARIFVPAYASGTKRAQIEAYGAELIVVPGPRSAATEAVRRAADAGAVYASHAYLPHGLAGMATIAFELVDQLDGAPGTVVVPVGQGTLLLGLCRGFEGMVAAGVIEGPPRMIGVQAQACAPLHARFVSPDEAATFEGEGETVAEGIRIAHPLRGREVLDAVNASAGRMIAVGEDAILSGRDALSRIGLYVEHTSAVVWPALRMILGDTPEPVVAILTGAGLKSP